MNKFSLLFFLTSSLALNNMVFAYDSKACETLRNVIDSAQVRFDQAEIAYKDPESICKDDSDPETCKSEINEEYEKARRDLIIAKSNYSAAGCENKTAIVRYSLRNGKKTFSVQNFSTKNIYIINFGFEWVHFNPETDFGGYNFSKISGGGIMSPYLPVGCFVADPLTVKSPISGFLNGVKDGSGALQLALKGKCQPFIDRLNTETFSIYFKDIQSMQEGVPSTPLLQLLIQDLPN